MIAWFRDAFRSDQDAAAASDIASSRPAAPMRVADDDAPADEAAFFLADGRWMPKDSDTARLRHVEAALDIDTLMSVAQAAGSSFAGAEPDSRGDPADCARLETAARSG